MTFHHTIRRLAVLGVGLGVALSAAACGSSDKTDTGSTSTADWTKKGPINYVQGKDTSGSVQKWIDVWNKDHPDEKVTLIELSDKADEQRASMIQNHNNKGASKYDIISVDVVWTAEFAATGVVMELPKAEFDTTGYLPAAVDAATYFDKLYAFPSTSDGAMLYYRKDLLDAAKVTAPPKTWDEMKAICKTVIADNPGMTCYGGQFQKYEGLTCNIAEWINSAGGQFLDKDGKPQVNSPEAMAGVNALLDSFKDGTISKEQLTWQEEPSRQAFQDGKLVFLRNWPYVYANAQKTDGSSKIVDKFAVAPIPGLTDYGVSTLGGHNMGVPAEASNLGTVKAFTLWWNNQEQQKVHVIATSNAPTIETLYTDPDLVKQFPYLTTLHESILKAQSRPKAVKYGDVTAAIQDATYSALNGSDAKAAFDTLQTKLVELTK